MQSRTNRMIARRFRINEYDEIQIQFSNYIRRRRYENSQDEALIEAEDTINTNPNFMKEKDINFRLYPFYINWKKLEANQQGYFRMFVHFGYFGASIYSLFKKKYPILNIKNILYIFSSFIPDIILRKNKKDENIKYLFDKLPDLDSIYQIILKKIIMFKEVSLYLIILKLYEISYIENDNKSDLEKVLKSEYSLGNYLTDDEYKNIYNEHYKRKISKIFEKLEENKGKEYEFANTKDNFFCHIKYVYKKFIKNEDNFI
jgi:hypothetical protein